MMAAFIRAFVPPARPGSLNCATRLWRDSNMRLVLSRQYHYCTHTTHLHLHLPSALSLSCGLLCGRWAWQANRVTGVAGYRWNLSIFWRGWRLLLPGTVPQSIVFSVCSVWTVSVACTPFLFFSSLFSYSLLLMWLRVVADVRGGGADSDALRPSVNGTALAVTFLASPHLCICSPAPSSVLWRHAHRARTSCAFLWIEQGSLRACEGWLPAILLCGRTGGEGVFGPLVKRLLQTTCSGAPSDWISVCWRPGSATCLPALCLPAITHYPTLPLERY